MIASAWTLLRYHEQQNALWRTKKRFVGVAAGRGSGKTELARRRIVRYLAVKKPWPDPMYFYALPTAPQAKRVAWRAIKALVPKEWLAKEPHETNMIIETKFGSSLYVVGMDKPQRIEGDQWDGGVIDESCDQKEGHFELSIQPALTHRNGWCWRIGVPKRTGVGARGFKRFCKQNPDEEFESFTWPSSDILTPDQLRYAQEHLDARDYAEQYGASWETIGGACFHAFDEVLNVQSVAYDPARPLTVGSDFNVNPMAWVVSQRYPNELRVLDEIWIRNTNTQKTLDVLHAKYKTHAAGWEFFGDATGAARKTSASDSDYIQIKNDGRFTGKRVFYPQSNPRVADRFASCNMLFCNAAGVRRCIIDPRCKHLIQDLQDRAYKEGSNEPNDYTDIGHSTDALGYIIHKVFPVRLSKPTQAPEVFTT